MKYPKKIRAKAKYKARPIYARPDDFAKMKATAAIHADHKAMVKAAARKSEYDRLTGLLDKLNPGLRGALLSERSKL